MRPLALTLVTITSIASSFHGAQAQGNEDWHIVTEPTSTESKAPSESQRQPSRSSSSSLSDFKLGMGLDQGLSVVAQFNRKVNVAAGNDGLAVDYIFDRGRFGSDVPFNWFIGAGGQIYKFEEVGPRVTLGVELPFARRWDSYAQLSPNIMFADNSAELGINAGFGVRYRF
ncbi:hypothetical protein [Vibrio hippocampi]|uniref:Outer membrane protein beta-barrel domain-containing protein n=1 Tax=Vibrio hippocampi TaxID=654686 RepID=A0ABN8DL06_9VIBR|nr:hypothetical protein [Vibrio hippocampi]CAH0526525.1 hypothetical protein VHP8226_01879 [Vibrio hippocampi]